MNNQYRVVTSTNHTQFADQLTELVNVGWIRLGDMQTCSVYNPTTGIVVTWSQLLCKSLNSNLRAAALD